MGQESNQVTSRGLKTLQVPEAFRVWLYRIAHHKAARFVRNEIRQEQVTASLAEAREEPSAANGEIALDAEALHKALEIGFRLPARCW
jgi:DNA-directed RNA polymerase specialized sigma24 family protein